MARIRSSRTNVTGWSICQPASVRLEATMNDRTTVRRDLLIVLYRTRFLGHTFALRGMAQLVFFARFAWRAIRQLLEAPALVVVFTEAHAATVPGRVLQVP